MTRVELLLRQIDQAFDRRAWHGTNLAGSLRGLTVAEAVFRPNPRRHNVWELAVHCAYWKYAVRRRLTGEKRGGFPLPGSNFFRRPESRTPKAADLAADLRLLRTMHRQLRTAVSSLRDDELWNTSPKQKWLVADEVAGIAQHDIYHAGQIQILRRLFRKQ
ncbi:MAG: DinB family protein [Thermoanaerobaculia bacterium]